MKTHLLSTTPPTIEPVTVDEYKTWARISTTTEDNTIADLITGVRQGVEDYLRKSLITQSWKLTIDLMGGYEDQFGDGVWDLPVTVLTEALPKSIRLPMGPVSSITSFTSYNTSNTSAVFSSSYYYLNSDRLILNDTASWPTSLRPMGAVEIIYASGYGATADTVPMGIRNAIKMATQSLYEARGMCSTGDDLPDKAKSALMPYRDMVGML